MSSGSGGLWGAGYRKPRRSRSEKLYRRMPDGKERERGRVSSCYSLTALPPQAPLVVVELPPLPLTLPAPPLTRRHMSCLLSL